MSPALTRASCPDYLGQLTALRSHTPASPAGLPGECVLAACSCGERVVKRGLVHFPFFQEEATKAKNVCLQEMRSARVWLGSGTLGPMGLVWIRWQGAQAGRF